MQSLHMFRFAQKEKAAFCCQQNWQGNLSPAEVLLQPRQVSSFVNFSAETHNDVMREIPDPFELTSEI